MRMPGLNLLSSGDTVGRWLVGRLLGRGRFGEVYTGTAPTTGASVAIKVEADAEASRRSRLRREARAYRALAGAPGVAQMRWLGPVDGGVALVLDRLGPSLKAFHRAVGCFSAAELALVASEALCTLEAMHSRGWIHGDVKPDNLLLARGVGSLVARPDGEPWLHAIDLGHSLPLATEARSKRRGTQGAVRYASISNQLLQPLGPSDDLEALAYSLAYLHRGQLPWSQVQAPTQPQRFELILQAKERETPRALFAGLPSVFPEFLCACRALGPEATPDYAALRTLFEESSLQRPSKPSCSDSSSRHRL